MSISSVSTVRFKESESTYSMKEKDKDNHHLADKKESNSFENSKNNGFGSRSVLFAPNVSSSSSSYSINEHLKLNNNNNNSSLNGNLSSTPTTSQLIKQTLSPLSQHRNIPLSSPSSQSSTTSLNYLDSTFSTSSLKNQLSTASLGTYQFPSSTLLLSNENKSDNSSVSLSPSKSIPNHSSTNNTNTLPSNLARNMLYQSESSYSLKNQEINFTSPGSTLNWNSQTSNIYGTLPKSSSPFSSIGSSSIATNLPGNVQSVKNEFEQLIARNQGLSSSQSTLGSSGMGSSGIGSSSLGSSGLNTSSLSTSENSNSSSISASGLDSSTKGGLSYGNYNTIGSYRLQYSSTNPFLPTFNPNSTDLLANDSEQAKDD